MNDEKTYETDDSNQIIGANVDLKLKQKIRSEEYIELLDLSSQDDMDRCPQDNDDEYRFNQFGQSLKRN